MKNPYEVFGRVVRMEVWYKTPFYCWFDTADLPRVQEYSGLWYANPARAPKGKYYVMAKFYDSVAKTTRSVMLHRHILKLTDPKVEGHHVDNDGLNNRRENLQAVTHKVNMRERWSNKDWEWLDAAHVDREEYRKERKIAARIAKENGLTRAGMWRIRLSQPGTGSERAKAYRTACYDAKVRTLRELQEARPKDGKWGVFRSGGMTAPELRGG